MNDVAVVILNWNGEELLKRFLPRVVENTSGADIVVADNASTDNSLEWISTSYPAIKLIRFKHNYGYAEGYNRAVKELTDYRFLILLNSDAAPAPGWIQPIRQTFEEPDVVAVQPKILWEKNHVMFEYAGAAGGFLDCNGYPYCRGRIFDTLETDNGQYDDEIEIFWASGASLAVKREAFLRAGGFDTLFFAHMEEIDLCWRLQLQGGKIMYQPQSVVYHLGGASLDASSPNKTFLNFRNNLLMLYKNLPQGKRKRILLNRRMILDALAFVRFILQGRFQHAKAIIKSHNAFRNMRENYNEFPSDDLLKTKCSRNIITDYYLKRRWTF